MDKAELIKKIAEGNRAETLKEILDGWMEIEKDRAIHELTETSRNPVDIRGDLQAALRIYGHVTALINQGKRAERKKDGRE